MNYAARNHGNEVESKGHVMRHVHEAVRSPALHDDVADMAAFCNDALVVNGILACGPGQDEIPILDLLLLFDQAHHPGFIANDRHAVDAEDADRQFVREMPTPI